jgi:hypothetical protein
LRQAFHRLPIAHVDGEWEERVAELFLQRAQAFRAAAGPDDIPATVGKTPCGRAAEA